MNKFKKIVSMLIALTIIFCLFSQGANASGPASPLTFKDGKFKILVFSDIHDRGDESTWADQLKFFEAALDTVMPDLVVFDGDNAGAREEEMQKQCIARLISPIAQRGIYLAVVMGNHDGEEGDPLTKKEHIAEFQKYEKCLTVVGPDINGAGNYNLTISGTNNKPKYNLWFFDCAKETDINGYGYVKKDQIAWYENTCRELAAENGGQVLPSIVFQHICVPEIYQLLDSSYFPVIYGIKGHNNYGDRYWTLDNDNTTIEGNFWECPCPADYNDGQFESWLKMGDVRLAVFGHDHKNTFSGEVDGIRLMYAGGAGFAGYHNGLSEACSLITIDEETLTYERELIKYTDVVGTYAQSYSFDDYFEHDCWWNILKLDFSEFFKCLGYAVKSLFV
jgi:predicted phosphodiesterase